MAREPPLFGSRVFRLIVVDCDVEATSPLTVRMTPLEVRMTPLELRVIPSEVFRICTYMFTSG